MSRYLVTGGAGFIGSNIVDELVAQGHKVRVLDNFSTGSKKNLEKSLDSIEVIVGDVRDVSVVEKAVLGIDYVLHQAAFTSVPRSIKEPAACNDVNVNGTLNLLLAAKNAGVKKLIFASSSSVYGDTPTLPKREAMAPNPKAPYAVSKLTGEYYCMVFSAVYGLATVCLRYFNVFGPRQDPNSQYSAVIPKFISMMLEGYPPVIFGDGRQSRDFTYVKNVVDANLLAAASDAKSGEAVNIACGSSVTLLELVEILKEKIDKKVQPVLSAGRAGDIKHSLADIAKAGDVLQYKPRVSFGDGIVRTVEYYQKVKNED